MKLTTTKIHQNSLIVRLLSHPWLVSQSSSAPSETWSMGCACDRLFSVSPMFCFECLHDSVIDPHHWFMDSIIWWELFLLHFVSIFVFWPSRTLAMKNPQLCIQLCAVQRGDQVVDPDRHGPFGSLHHWSLEWHWSGTLGQVGSGSGLARWSKMARYQVYQDMDGCGHSGIADSPITLGRNHGEFLHFPHRRYQFEGAQPPFADKAIWPISKISEGLFLRGKTMSKSLHLGHILKRRTKPFDAYDDASEIADVSPCWMWGAMPKWRYTGRARAKDTTLAFALFHHFL